MREPKQLIEECKKHLRDTEQYKHEYKKDIRKLITALEKQLIIADVSHRRELLTFLEEVASEDRLMSSARIRERAAELLKVNCA